MKLHQPHDKLFKETFSDIEVAGDFLTHYLPSTLSETIDVKSLKMINDSFIEEKLQDSRSDLLYETMINGEKTYVYFLFEHKSYPTKDIALQLLAYMLEIWKREIDKKKADSLPFVLSLVIYHGAFPWKNPRLLRDWMINYDCFSDDIKQFVPDFNFCLYDFSYDNNLEVLGQAKLQAYLHLIQHIYLKDWEEIIRVLMKIESLLLQIDGKYFDTISLYLLKSREHVPIEKIKKKLTEEGRKRFMSTADQLMREGKMEGKKETVKNALKLGIDKDKIAILTELSLEEIEEIEGKIVSD